MRRAPKIVDGDGAERFGKRTAVRGDGLPTSAGGFFPERFGEFLAGQAEPERRVAGVPVGRVDAEEGVRKRAAVLMPGEEAQNLPDSLDLARPDQAASGDEGVPSPVEKPGISGNDGKSVLASDEEIVQGFS